ncbi:pseudouridylate synthase 7-like protein isoform X1 [Cucumis melo var. makuwa]|uniref:Pseudouridylate synthase 7-like protein isoform X1 n=1 Tax=Cucumis melo var. makuwa TaxID=1194695 RepID=A0A5D3DYX0_CUCMM|nr:pseudouridylate synthase 7-like protein isoform X1 [Cucumis melo var. makuwa]
MGWYRPGASSFTVLKPYFLCNSLTAPKLTNRSSSIAVMTTKSIGESDVGILSYISSLPGFRGILKQRYSDFIVNEVDTDGNVVHLTSLDAPPEIVSESGPTIVHSTSQSYVSEIELFRSLAGDSDAEILETFLKQINSGANDDISPIVFSPDTSKTHRTAVHNFFKKFKFLVTDTIDGPDSSSKCVRVRVDSGVQNNRGRFSKKRKERGDKPFDSRGSDNWPEHVGKFLRFHLYKENKDTQEALGLIGKMLGIQTRSFGFAGTKDKRSISTQRVTVFKQHASRIAALNDRLIGIKLGNFSYIQEGLLLGQLLGNRFTITLRGVVANSEDVIKASAEALGTHGFINYFGLQHPYTNIYNFYMEVLTWIHVCFHVRSHFSVYHRVPLGGNLIVREDRILSTGRFLYILSRSQHGKCLSGLRQELRLFIHVPSSEATRDWKVFAESLRDIRLLHQSSIKFMEKPKISGEKQNNVGVGQSSMGCSVLPTKKQGTALTFNQIRCSSPVKKPEAEVALIKLSNGKLEELIELPGNWQAFDYWCRKTFEAIGDHFEGLEAISVETLNDTNVVEAKIQIKWNLCGFMPATIEIADENRGTFFLNYGDIEVLCPSPKVKGDLLLKDFFNPIDLIRVLQVMKDEEGEAPEIDPEWGFIKDA